MIKYIFDGRFSCCFKRYYSTKTLSINSINSSLKKTKRKRKNLNTKNN